MIEKRSHYSLLIETKIDVSTLTQMGWKNYVGVQCDTRLAFVIDGIHYDGIVVECDGIIAPGSSGNATFLTLSDSLLGTNITIGSRIDLKGGSALVAIAEILAIKRVFVKRAPEDERGYVILDQDEESKSN